MCQVNSFKYALMMAGRNRVARQFLFNSRLVILIRKKAYKSLFNPL